MPQQNNQTPPDSREPLSWERPALYVILLCLIGLGVLAFLNPPGADNGTGHALIFALVGFVGGLLFFLVDPLQDQRFRLKGVVNLTGATAIAAGFMFLASQLVPVPTDCPVCVVNFDHLEACVADQIEDHLEKKVRSQLDYGSVEAWRAGNQHRGHDWVIRRLDDQYFPRLKNEMTKSALLDVLNVRECPGLPSHGD